MSPQDFTAIKNKIQTSTILTDQERAEWLALLPRMSGEELKELDRILSIRMPAKVQTSADLTRTNADRNPPFLTPSPREGGKVDIDHPHRSFLGRLLHHEKRPPPAPSLHFGGQALVKEEERPQGLKPPVSKTTTTAGEIGRGVERPQVPPPLSRSSTSLPPSTAVISPRQERVTMNGLLRRPEFAKTEPPKSPALSEIAKLAAAEIRKPPSVYVNLEKLHRDIKDIVANTDIVPRQIIAAFQSSPLYRDYLRTGLSLLNKDSNLPLSRDEFEAVADFHTSLKKL